MITVVPVPDQILESSQFSTCTELPILHQLHGGLPIPLSHNAVVEVLKLCAGAGPLGKGELEEWKSAVLGLSGASEPVTAPLMKPMAAFSLAPVTTMAPISMAPVTTMPPHPQRPAVASITPGVPLGALSPTVMGGLSPVSPAKPKAPILKPTFLPPLPSPTAHASPSSRSVHFDLEEDEFLDHHHHPRVPAHLSHTPPPSARQMQFNHSHLNDEYFASRFDMDDYGSSEPASASMSPAVPVLELGPRATQASLGGFIPMSCAPEVDPGMAKKLAQRAQERQRREQEEREHEERVKQRTLEMETKSPRDVMVEALMAAHLNKARHAAGIPLVPVLPTLPAPPLVALTSASQVRTLSPADADAWAYYYLGAECDPGRAGDAILAAVGVV